MFLFRAVPKSVDPLLTLLKTQLLLILLPILYFNIFINFLFQYYVSLNKYSQVKIW